MSAGSGSLGSPYVNTARKVALGSKGLTKFPGRARVGGGEVGGGWEELAKLGLLTR